MSGAALYVLFESASGYALFSVEGIDDFQRANEEANKYIEYVLTTPTTSDPTRKVVSMPIIASGVPRRQEGLWAWERISARPVASRVVAPPEPNAVHASVRGDLCFE